MHRINMTLKKSDEAISPVIGVMLMLAVTIIIAAVVVAVSTGMVTETKKAPNAVFEVTIDRNVVIVDDVGGFGGFIAGPDLTITHISGDAVHSKDMKLFFSWTDPAGDLHESTYSAAEFAELCPNEMLVPLSYGYGYTYWFSQQKETDHHFIQPLYQKDVFGGSGGRKLNIPFGEVIFTPGVKVRAFPEHLIMASDYYSSNVGSPFMDAILNNGVWANPDAPVPGDGWEDAPDMDFNPSSDPFFGDTASMIGDEDLGYPYLYYGGIMDYLPEGTAVDVKILHIPSNKIIYDKVVYVTDSRQEGTEWAEDLVIDWS